MGQACSCVLKPTVASKAGHDLARGSYNPPNGLAALPTGILQHIIECASTWQIPGTCLAAPVCRTWQSAAAGCSGIRLLYHAGLSISDTSLATWIGRHGHQLGAFTLTLSCGYVGYHPTDSMVLEALAQAAAAAQAAGRPLQLHTLRVLGATIDFHLVAKLLSGLPSLRCLQVTVAAPRFIYTGTGYLNPEAAGPLVQKHLAPLQAATQLEELYLDCPDHYANRHYGLYIAGLLPPSLQRLSWNLPNVEAFPNLAHLPRLSFLQLRVWSVMRPTAYHLPPSLQELQLLKLWLLEGLPLLLEEQLQRVTRWQLCYFSTQEQLLGLTNLTAIDVDVCDLRHLSALTHLQQLSALMVHDPAGGMEITGFPIDFGALMATAAALRRLRCLHLDMPRRRLPLASGLVGVTQVTQLLLRVRCDGLEQYGSMLAAEVGTLTGLQWLSVPDALLCAEQPWLYSLRRLRVLGLQCSTRDAAGGSGRYAHCVPWLEASGLHRLQPCLRVLCWGGVPADKAVAWQLRRRLQQLVGASGCEVVLGPDLDQVADPTQQLAGLPVVLQQAVLG